MQRRAQLCSNNAQQMMQSASGAQTVEHDDHDDQFVDEEKQNLQAPTSLRATACRRIWQSSCVHAQPLIIDLPLMMHTDD